MLKRKAGWKEKMANGRNSLNEGTEARNKDGMCRELQTVWFFITA